MPIDPQLKRGGKKERQGEKSEGEINLKKKKKRNFLTNPPSKEFV